MDKRIRKSGFLKAQIASLKKRKHHLLALSNIADQATREAWTAQLDATI